MAEVTSAHSPSGVGFSTDSSNTASNTQIPLGGPVGHTSYLVLITILVKDQ